ncbi:MAG: nucleotidyl transferase AbiEii/AbiGii toxin family protein [Patescibacteria group bacterium]|nr:nucleotidyl transferase AbiEii/AbiGii toxin family protein [Patescibacteria group bacterium]
MIEKRFLQEIAVKKETSFRNVLREYFQHLFLTEFYKQPSSENYLFKGGTALKLLFNSPRFSEDLDFSGFIKESTAYEKILEQTLLSFSFENIKVDLLESKATSGGHLAIIDFLAFREKIEIRSEISFRKGILKREILLATPLIVPSYKVYALSRELLVEEKIGALLSRQKPRDFFDLYFILRKEDLRQVLKLSQKQRSAIISWLDRSQEKTKIQRELKPLLPKSYWQVIANFPLILKKELGEY